MPRIRPLMCRTMFLAVALNVPLMAASDFDPAQAARFADLALDCVHKEYPNKIAHALNSDADVKPPRELTPAFYGCYDWHSSVHGHWLLVRLARLFPNAPFAAERAARSRKSLTPAHIAQEVKYLSGRRPHLVRAPLRPGVAAATRRRAEGMGRPAGAPVVRHAAPAGTRPSPRVSPPGCPNWQHPIRTGEHNNTAFAMGLMLDYARIAGNTRLRQARGIARAAITT